MAELSEDHWNPDELEPALEESDEENREDREEWREHAPEEPHPNREISSDDGSDPIYERSDIVYGADPSYARRRATSRPVRVTVRTITTQFVGFYRAKQGSGAGGIVNHGRSEAPSLDPNPSGIQTPDSSHPLVVRKNRTGGVL